MVLDQLNNDLKTAMKAQDKERTSVLRMLLSSIKMKEIELRPNKITEKDIILCVKNNIKTRKDSILEFKKGNRPDLIQKEEKEIVVLTEYLPKQLTSVEIEEIAKKIILELGAQSKKDLGRVMGKLISEYKEVIDGKEAKEIVDKLLP
jgi:uncharacterized protein YqeY